MTTNELNFLKLMSTLLDLGLEIDKKQKDPDEIEDLNDGFTLRKVPDKLVEKLFGKTSYNDYGYLFKDNTQISDKIFRKGGVSQGFKGEFCQLIVYADTKELKYGKHVIINKVGDICLLEKPTYSKLYYLGGIVATMDRSFYNLLTGKEILKYMNYMSNDNWIFAETYHAGDKRIYKISKKLVK